MECGSSHDVHGKLWLPSPKENSMRNLRNSSLVWVCILASNVLACGDNEVAETGSSLTEDGSEGSDTGSDGGEGGSEAGDGGEGGEGEGSDDGTDVGGTDGGR